MRRAVVVLTTLAAIAVGAVAHAAATVSSDPAAAKRAARWIAAQLKTGGDGQAADAIVVLRATGARTRAAALRAGAGGYLASDVTPAGPAAKVVLGLAAAGVGNPRCAGALDLLSQIKAGYRNGIYGADAFDEGAALLALHALDERVGRAAIDALRGARHRGGWPLRITGAGQDDAESTAILLEGLHAAGVSVRDPMVRSALDWIHRQRLAAGGYGSDAVDADSTGVILAAENALGVADPRALRALKGLQRPSGAIQYEAADPGNLLLASLDGAIGLSGQVRPLGARRSPPRGC
jgi:hypothetical protein